MTYYERKKISGPAILYYIYSNTSIKQCKIYKKQLYVNNSAAGSMAFGFDHTFKSLGHAKCSSQHSCTHILVLTCLVFVAGEALKGGFIKLHDFFPVINNPVKISLNKFETLLLYTWC